MTALTKAIKETAIITNKLTESEIAGSNIVVFLERKFKIIFLDWIKKQPFYKNIISIPSLSCILLFLFLFYFEPYRHEKGQVLHLSPM